MRFDNAVGWRNIHLKRLTINYWFDEVSDPRHDQPKEIIERIRVSEEDIRNDLRELLIGLLRFERLNGYQTITEVSDVVVDEYLNAGR